MIVNYLMWVTKDNGLLGSEGASRIISLGNGWIVALQINNG